MWWKAIVNWLRDRVDVDVDLDIDEGKVAVAVTLKVGELTVFTEHFEWPLPSAGQPRKLLGGTAKRSRVLPRAA